MRVWVRQGSVCVQVRHQLLVQAVVLPPFFIVVVSPCRCEPLRAGCFGGEGVLGVS